MLYAKRRMQRFNVLCVQVALGDACSLRITLPSTIELKDLEYMHDNGMLDEDDFKSKASRIFGRLVFSFDL